MGSLIDIDGPAGLLILAVPLAVLLAACVLALTWPRRRAVRATVPHEGEPFAPGSMTKGTEIDTERMELRRAATTLEATGGDEAVADAAGAATSDAHVPAGADEAAAADRANGEPYDDDFGGLLVDGPGFPPSSRAAEPPVVPKGEVERLIGEALAQRATNDEHAAAETLRAAIMQASRSGDRRGHARARLELGDIAQAEGDLITACEHWQMARSLYEEEDRPAEAEQCGSRMLKNGCPTDWVLTDF